MLLVLVLILGHYSIPEILDLVSKCRVLWYWIVPSPTQDSSEIQKPIDNGTYMYMSWCWTSRSSSSITLYDTGSFCLYHKGRCPLITFGSETVKFQVLNCIRAESTWHTRIYIWGISLFDQEGLFNNFILINFYISLASYHPGSKTSNVCDLILQ